MSPLSLRADSHSETLTGCPEAGARVMEERKRRGERRKCDIKTIREIPNPSGKQEKKNVLIPTAGQSLLLQSKKVINKSYNSA